MFEKPKDYRLYILMRQDMDSMNPGKAVAQGAHAANQFVHEHGGHPERNPVEGYVEWASSTPQGFGTTITLAVNKRELATVVLVAKALGFATGITHDPSYPIRDGEVTHLIPQDTCGYVFGDADALRPILGNFPLMK